MASKMSDMETLECFRFSDKDKGISQKLDRTRNWTKLDSLQSSSTGLNTNSAKEEDELKLVKNLSCKNQLISSTQNNVIVKELNRNVGRYTLTVEAHSYLSSKIITALKGDTSSNARS